MWLYPSRACLQIRLFKIISMDNLFTCHKVALKYVPNPKSKIFLDFPYHFKETSNAL